MNHGFRGGEGVAAAGPAAVLDAKDIEWQRLRADWNDAVLADDAILLAAGNHFAGEKQQRSLAAIDQHELVYLRAAGNQRCGFDAISRTAHVIALLGDDRFTGSERCIEGFEVRCVRLLRREHREDGERFVGDGFSRVPTGTESGPDASSDSARTRGEELRVQRITAARAARIIKLGIQMSLWLGCMAFSFVVCAGDASCASLHSENGHADDSLQDF